MIRVLVVDDQELVRSGFRVILETEPDITVVGEARDGAEAVELAARTSPDVICMDVEMPVMNGIEATRRILALGEHPADGLRAHPADGLRAHLADAPEEHPADAPGAQRPPAVLILTTFGHEEYLFDALAAGVSGFLLKTARAEQLIDAVRTLDAGQAVLGPDITRLVMERAAHHGAAPRSESSAEAPNTAHSQRLDEVGVTEREREVLRLLARGESNAEIAAHLFLGEATVKTHVSNLLQKLGARDRIQAVVWVHANGIVL